MCSRIYGHSKTILVKGRQKVRRGEQLRQSGMRTGALLGAPPFRDAEFTTPLSGRCVTARTRAAGSSERSSPAIAAQRKRMWARAAGMSPLRHAR